MKTYQPKRKEVKRNWHLINAKDEVLGRLATKVVQLLMGKQKPNYAPHMDMGDYVVIINAKDVVVTGKKGQQKVYHGHSGYPGGFKTVKYSKLIAENPARIIKLAISGMLPENRLKSKRLVRLKIFANDKYPYSDKFAKATGPEGGMKNG